MVPVMNRELMTGWDLQDTENAFANTPRGLKKRKEKKKRKCCKAKNHFFISLGHTVRHVGS